MRYRAQVASNRFQQGLIGLLLGLAGHLLAFGAGLIAGRLVRPSAGGGFEDLAAVVMVFLGVEALVALAALTAGGVLIKRGRRDQGIGIIIGWLIGIVAFVIFLRR